MDQSSSIVERLLVKDLERGREEERGVCRTIFYNQRVVSREGKVREQNPILLNEITSKVPQYTKSPPKWEESGVLVRT